MKKLLMVIPMIFPLCLTFGCQKDEDVAEEPMANVWARVEGVKPLDVEDALLTYSREGTGIPCVVLYGGENLGSKIYSKELKRHIEFIHAYPKNISKEEAKNFTLDTVIDDIEKARIALGVEKIAVMGHSMYSIIPPAYGLKYPEHASHLIVIGGLPSISEMSDNASNEYWEKDASEERKEIHRRNREALTEEVMSKLSPGEARIRNYLANIPLFFYDPEFNMSDIWEGVETNIDFVNRYWELIYGVDITDKFHLIKTPVLVISGRYDFWAPYYLWDEVKETIPDITFILFENAGHNPMLEIPEEFDKKIIDWIRSH